MLTDVSRPPGIGIEFVIKNKGTVTKARRPMTFWGEAGRKQVIGHPMRGDPIPTRRRLDSPGLGSPHTCTTPGKGGAPKLERVTPDLRRARTFDEPSLKTDPDLRRAQPVDRPGFGHVLGLEQ